MKNPRLADGVNRVPPSKIRELANLAIPMQDVLKLHFGESDLPTPQFIKDAVGEALDEGYTYYTENAGIPELREAIARKYMLLHDTDLDPGTEIVVTASGVQALNVAVRCVLDPGDEALVLTPNWPNVSAIASLYSAVPVEIPFVRQYGRFAIDFEALESAVTSRTRLLTYSSPSNPLGWVASVSEQKGLLDFCRRHGIWLLADEVYERFYYDGSVAPSILRLCDRKDAVAVIQSFSKSYCMTGWRLGWIAARPDLAGKAAQMNEFIVSHAPSMIQRAGIVAVEKGEDAIRTIVREIGRRIAFAYEMLSSNSQISLNRPEGAFYLFPAIEGVDDSFSFAAALLDEEKVSVAPGVAFGRGGEGSIRICCAADLSVLEPALGRMMRFLDKYAG